MLSLSLTGFAVTSLKFKELSSQNIRDVRFCGDIVKSLVLQKFYGKNTKMIQKAEQARKQPNKPDCRENCVARI